MTDIGTIRAFVTADQTEYNKALDDAGKKTEKFATRATKRLDDVGKSVSGLGKSLSVAVTAPLVALGAGLLKTASDAEETANKFSVVFSGIASDAERTSRSIADSFGLADTEAKKLLGDTGDLLTGFGFTQEAALQMSADVQILAADLASFTNIQGGTARASDALTKALLGEREMAKALGISIMEADVQARVLQNRLKGLTFDTERQAKAFATLQLAQEQSKNAIGDFERSSSSLANQMKIMAGETTDMAVAWGNELIPVAKALVGWVRSATEGFTSLAPETRRLAIVVAGLAAAAGPLLFVAGKLISTFAMLASGVAFLLGNFLLIAGVVAAVGASALLLGENWDWLVDKFRAVANFFGEFGAFLRDENAVISDSTRTAIEFIAKTWLSLKVAWNVVSNAMVGTVRVILDSISSFISGIEWLAEKVGLELPKGVKGFQSGLDIMVESLEDTEKANAKVLADMVAQWDSAPAILRNDVNQLVDTFKALPAGIKEKIESAFPGAVAAIQELVGKVQAFIDTGAVNINIPVKMKPQFSIEELGGDLQSQIDQMLGDDALSGGFGGLEGGPSLFGPVETADTIQERFDLQNEMMFNQAVVRQQVLDMLTEQDDIHIQTSKEAWDSWAKSILSSAKTWQTGMADAFAGMASNVVAALASGDSAADAFKTSIVSTMASLASELISQSIKLAIAQIAINEAQVVGNAAASAPHPYLIPLFVGLGLAALAAGLASVGWSGSKSSGGSAAVGDSSEAEAEVDALAPLAGGVQESTVIGGSEDELEFGQPEMRAVVSGDDLVFIVTRAVTRGSNDGVNTLALQGT